MEEDLFIRSIALGGGCASPYRAAPGGERNERRNLYVVRIDFLPYVETEILRIFRRGDLGGFGCIEAAEGFLPAVCDIGDGGDRFALGKVTELRKADNGGIRFGNVMAARCRIPDPAFYRLGRGILELYGMRIVHLHVVEFHGPVGVHHGHLAVDLLPCERFGDIAGIRSRGVRPVVDGIGILRGIYGERAARGGHLVRIGVYHLVRPLHAVLRQTVPRVFGGVRVVRVHGIAVLMPVRAHVPVFVGMLRFAVVAVRIDVIRTGDHGLLAL